MLLAKSADETGQAESLYDHTCNVVAKASELCDRIVLNPEEIEDLKSSLALAAALHDLGKGATGFQRMLRAETPDWNGWRHEILSAAFASALGARAEIVFAVLTHHKQIPGDSASTLSRNNVVQIPRLMLEEWTGNAEEIAQLWSSLAQRIGRTDLASAVEPSPGLRQIRDWLDSGDQRRRIPFPQRRKASLLRGLLIAADHLASGHTSLPPLLHPCEFVPKPEITLRNFQRRCGDTSGHAVLRAPTGSGKTEAALLWAAHNQHELGRLFYVLPNMASINAMHARLQREFPAKGNSIGLLHSRAAHHLFATLQHDQKGDPHKSQQESMARARLAKEMYYPFRVCTPHQLLRYTLHGRGWEQMLAEIPGACVIFDEVHSYDPELAGLTLGTARLFADLGAKVMFISATLPKFLEMELRGLIAKIEFISPNPEEPTDREVAGLLRHRIEILDSTILDNLPAVMALADAGRHVLIVCNHVRSAQDVFRKIPEAYRPKLLHGRFHMRDRQERERELASAELPRVLVATQVVEVSLDVSFDVGFFEAAPVDALTQRMGRVNRRGKAEMSAPIFICTQQLNKHRLYDDALVRDSLEQLGLRRGSIGEQDLVEVCDIVYRNGYSPEQAALYRQRLLHPFFSEFEEHLVAGKNENWADIVIDKSDGRAEVLPRDLQKEYDSLISEKRWLEADGLLVNVYAQGKPIDRSKDPWIIRAPYTNLGLEL